MEEMRKILANIGGHLQDLHSDNRAMSQDLRRMTARVDHMDETLTKLQSDFVGLSSAGETVFTLFQDHETRIRALEQKG
ncbi:MAG: hypothetical protein ACYCW6_04255 [Candidatus Xenobia bacterium]